MKNDILTSAFVERFVEFQTQRIQFLREFSLDSAFHNIHPIRLWMSTNQSAPAIIRRLITLYVEPKEEVLFAQVVARIKDFLDEDVEKSEINSEIARHIDAKWVAQLDAEYEAEFALSMNRHLALFIPKFCDSDGYINWEKIVAFNSSVK